MGGWIIGREKANVRKIAYIKKITVFLCSSVNPSDEWLLSIEFEIVKITADGMLLPNKN